MNKCLHLNGTCLIGCDAGYQGFLCKTCKYTVPKKMAMYR